MFVVQSHSGLIRLKFAMITSTWESRRVVRDATADLHGPLIREKVLLQTRQLRVNRSVIEPHRIPSL